MSAAVHHEQREQAIDLWRMGRKLARAMPSRTMALGRRPLLFALVPGIVSTLCAIRYWARGQPAQRASYRD